AGAAAEMRDGETPASLYRVCGESAGIVAIGASLEAVKEHHGALRGLRAAEVDIDEIAVGRLPSLPAQRYAARRQKRGNDRLQVAARQPPRCDKAQCRSLGGASRDAVCGWAGRGEA